MKRIGNTTRSRALRVASLVVAVLFAISFAPRELQAQDFFWATDATGNWNLDTNWNPVGVPNAAGETAQIDAAGNPYTVTLNINPTIDAFTLDSADATLFASGRTLSVSSTTDLISGLVDWRASVFTGGTLNNQTTLQIGGSSSITSASFNQSGTIDILGGLGGANTSLTVGVDFTNNGTINLETSTANSATLTRSGTLTNADTINVGGAGAGTRSIAVTDLVNDATINVNQSVGLTAVNGVTTNNANFNVAIGADVTFSTNGTFTQAGGTLDNQGSVSLITDTFNFDGGVISGNAIDLVASSLNIGVGSVGAGSFSFRSTGNTVSGDVAAAQTITVNGGAGGTNAAVTATTDFTNNGTIHIETSTNNSATFTRAGSVINEGTINIGGGGTGARSLAVTDLVNNDTINVNQSVGLTAVGGVTTNNANFNVAIGADVTFSTNGTFTQAGGTLDNQGSVSLITDTFNFNGGVVSGNAIDLVASSLNIGVGSVGAGSFSFRSTGNTMSGDVAAAQTITVNGGAGGTNAAVTATTDFTNNGTIHIETSTNNSASLTRAGSVTNEGTINIGGGGTGARSLAVTDLVNNDTINVNQSVGLTAVGGETTNNANFNVAVGADVTFSTNSTFTQAGGTLDNQGSVQLLSDTFNFDGGVISGNAIDLVASSLNIGIGSLGAGSFSFRSTGNNLSGDIATLQTITVNGGVGATNAAVTAGADFTNHGTIRIDTISANSSTMTRVGTITNGPAGAIHFGGAGGGTRSLAATLDNQGFVQANRSGTIGRIGALHVNSGVLQLADAAATLSFTGTSLTNQAGGRIEGIGTLNVSAAGFNFINDGTLAPGLSAGTLAITGNVLSQSNAVLEMEIGGTIPGSEYDVLSVTGTLTLDGILELTLLPNTSIPSDAVLMIADSGATLAGNFTNILNGDRLSTTDGFGSFLVHYGAASVFDPSQIVLSEFIAIPEPSTWLLTTMVAIGAGAGVWRRRRRCR